MLQASHAMTHALIAMSKGRFPAPSCGVTLSGDSTRSSAKVATTAPWRRTSDESRTAARSALDPRHPRTREKIRRRPLNARRFATVMRPMQRTGSPYPAHHCTSFDIGRASVAGDGGKERARDVIVPGFVASAEVARLWHLTRDFFGPRLPLRRRSSSWPNGRVAVRARRGDLPCSIRRRRLPLCDGLERTHGGANLIVDDILQTQLQACDVAALERALQFRRKRFQLNSRRRDEVEAAADQAASFSSA